MTTTLTKQYPAGALLQARDICRNPKTGEPGLLPVSVRTWLNWVEQGIAPKGRLIGQRTRVWTIEQVLAIGEQREAA